MTMFIAMLDIQSNVIFSCDANNPLHTDKPWKEPCWVILVPPSHEGGATGIVFQAVDMFNEDDNQIIINRSKFLLAYKASDKIVQAYNEWVSRMNQAASNIIMPDTKTVIDITKGRKN